MFFTLWLFASSMDSLSAAVIAQPKPAAIFAQQPTENPISSQAATQYQQGTDAYTQGDYSAAIANYQAALSLYQQANDLSGSSRAHYALGLAYYLNNQYPLAIAQYQESLLLQQQFSDPPLTAAITIDLGLAYEQIGERAKALEIYHQAIALLQGTEETYSLGRVLFNTGLIYDALSSYSSALDYYQQALSAFINSNNSNRAGTALANIAKIYGDVGDFAQSLSYYQQALTVFERSENMSERSRVLNNLGFISYRQKDFATALDYFQQALSIRETANDVQGQGRTLEGIGEVYVAQNDYERAIPVLKEALKLSQSIADTLFEGQILNHLGTAYRLQGQLATAAESYYRQSLAISRANGNRAGEAVTLSNLGRLHTEQQQRETAIAFYKRSINITEAIRKDIESFPRQQREAYTDLVADRYRELADLLLTQGRIREAQQVLELLKIQEIWEYTAAERGPNAATEVLLLPQEEAVVNQYLSLTAFSQQLQQCVGQQSAQCISLRGQSDQLSREFRRAISTLEREIRSRIANDEALLDPNFFVVKAQEITAAQPGSVIIYPLVLEDKLWLLWATADGVSSKREIPVTQRQLGETVVKFRTLVEDKYSDISELQVTAQQLYDWLIKPIEDELSADQNIQNLIFSLDRITRYIPMAALFDGDHYLIEKYRISTILSAALTNTQVRSPIEPDANILAAGVSTASPDFGGALPHVPTELDSIVQELSPADTQGIYPGVKLLNEAFSFVSVREALLGKQLLHLATHGQFINQQDQSYLLMGNGEKLPIPEIETLSAYLKDVRLVVLSACQTALGGPNEEGMEIAGMSYYFLKSQVDAVIGSLWNVNDASTSELMQRFYQALAAGTQSQPVTKASALQHAQHSLLRGSSLATAHPDANPDRFMLVPRNAESAPQMAVSWSHPYYWAPFILVGDGS